MILVTTCSHYKGKKDALHHGDFMIMGLFSTKGKIQSAYKSWFPGHIAWLSLPRCLVSSSEQPRGRSWYWAAVEQFDRAHRQRQRRRIQTLFAAIMKYQRFRNMPMPDLRTLRRGLGGKLESPQLPSPSEGGKKKKKSPPLPSLLPSSSIESRFFPFSSSTLSCRLLCNTAPLIPSRASTGDIFSKMPDHLTD